MGRRLILIAVLLLFGCNDTAPTELTVAEIEAEPIDATNWEIQWDDSTVLYRDEDAKITEHKLIQVDTAADCEGGFGPIVIDLQPPNDWRTIDVDCGKIVEAEGGGDE